MCRQARCQAGEPGYRSGSKQADLKSLQTEHRASAPKVTVFGAFGVCNFQIREAQPVRVARGSGYRIVSR